MRLHAARIPTLFPRRQARKCVSKESKVIQIVSNVIHPPALVKSCLERGLTSTPRDRGLVSGRGMGGRNDMGIPARASGRVLRAARA